MQTITLPIAALDHFADLATTNGTEFDEVEQNEEAM